MNSLIVSLRRLLAEEGALTGSSLTTRQRSELEQFARNTRLLTITRHGRKTVYRVNNKKGIVDYLSSVQPLTEEQLDSSLPARSRNIGMEKNSKKGLAAHQSSYLLMKAWDQDVQWRNETRIMTPAGLTENFGAAVLRIVPEDQWWTNGPVLLVENQALFDRCDWLPDNFSGCLVYYSGHLPNLLIQWLAERKRCLEVALFPDYDGIGLSNFVRLTESLHPELQLNFYWMPDWENKLERYGNSEIWLKTRTQFDNAIKKLEALGGLNADFQKLANLSQRYGRALEQESIWL